MASAGDGLDEAGGVVAASGLPPVTLHGLRHGDARYRAAARHDLLGAAGAADAAADLERYRSVLGECASCLDAGDSAS